MEVTGQDNMPAFSNYKFKPISKLLKEREIGLSKTIFKSSYKSTRNNSHTDLEIIRSMLCDEKAHLEVIYFEKNF